MGRAGTVQRVHAAAQPPGANRKHGGQQSRVSLLIGAIGAVTSAKTCGKQAERWQGGKVVSALALMHCANALCASAKPAAALHLCKGSLPCRCMDAGSRGLRLTLESRWATIHLASGDHPPLLLGQARMQRTWQRRSGSRSHGRALPSEAWCG